MPTCSEMTIDKIVNASKQYFVDTTGSLLTSVPIYAAIETFVAGMSVEVSLESRLKIVAARYCGLGIIYAGCRDFSRKIFNVKKEDGESKKLIHDSAYTAMYNIPVAIAAYVSSGANSQQAIAGTMCAFALGLVSGPLTGYNVDVFRDLMETRQSERTPSFIKNIGKFKRKILAASLIAASIFTTAGIYTLKNHVSSASIEKSAQNNK